MTDPSIYEELFRREWPALIGAAARITGDLDRGEEIAQDALVAALTKWPFRGMPDRPGAWLLTVARNRARNWVRDEARARAREEATSPAGLEDPPASDEYAIDDERLRLVFVCCHPVLSQEGRVALTLRLVGGLSTPEIARAFLVPLPTAAQRIVRAKRQLAEAAIAFEVPSPEEWPGRLPGVLDVIYLIFNEGYSAASGEQLMRPRLCAEALRLSELLVELVETEPEVTGLHGLLLLHSARLETRADHNGNLILLEDQDRTRWDPHLVARGEAAIEAALRLGEPGPMTVQAMIAACHVRARIWQDTDWDAIVALYGRLVELAPSPVVFLNRAVAVSMRTPDLALDELVTLEDRLVGYAPFWAARADILRRLDRFAEAASAYRRTAALGPNEPERRLLLQRAERCALLG